MQDLNNTIKLHVKGNEYTVSFPTVGQFRSIETLKSVLSNGSYGAMLSQNTVYSNKALDIIDMEACLTVLAPDLFKDLKCQFKDLGFEDYAELEEAYKEQFLPWYNKWMDKFKDLK